MGTHVGYLDGHGYHHKCLLSGLQLGTLYYYKVGDSLQMSGLYTFKTAPGATSLEPIRIAVYGDMGWKVRSIVHIFEAFRKKQHSTYV